MALLSDQMSYEDVAALGNADAEQVDEHDHVVAVGSGGEGLVADLVDEKGDDYLRETV